MFKTEADHPVRVITPHSQQCEEIRENAAMGSDGRPLVFACRRRLTVAIAHRQHSLFGDMSDRRGQGTRTQPRLNGTPWPFVLNYPS
jgi:hypothetical protein